MPDEAEPQTTGPAPVARRAEDPALTRRVRIFETAGAAAPGKTPGKTPGKAGGDSTPRYPFRPVLALMVLILLSLIATAGYKSYRDLDAAKSHERKLLDRITQAKDRIQALDGRIDRIRNDPAMLERLAREDLGLVRAGDVVIVLPDRRPAAPADMGSSGESTLGESTPGESTPGGAPLRPHD